jgi:ribosomal RNA assembly protein
MSILLETLKTPIVFQLPMEEDYTAELKVPADRVAVFIGKGGETKRDLEIALKCKMNVDSVEGDVVLTSKNSVDLMVAKDVIKAIARGFNPNVAKQLLNDDYVLQLISLNDYNASKPHQERLKGRVIGRDGRSRELIEEYTNCSIVIYGKTIGILGRGEEVRIAYKAVETLLEGSPHAYVYKWLEKQKGILKQQNMPEL